MTGATVGKTDPAHPQTIVVSGFPATRQSDVRALMQNSDYPDLRPGNMPDGSLTLTMKLSAMNDLATRTVETSIETIRARVDKLGVSEPVIQKYGLGENQILVELPGYQQLG